MMNLINNHKSSKGFTLIELMIVVAIIGILAAIAIPQFSEYRKKAFNGAANADLRNAMTSEEASFSEDQAYASTTSNPVKGPGPATGLPAVRLSKNVVLRANATAAGTGAAYAVVSGHVEGSVKYGGDSLGNIKKNTTITLADPSLDAGAYTTTDLSAFGGTSL